MLAFLRTPSLIPLLSLLLTPLTVSASQGAFTLRVQGEVCIIMAKLTAGNPEALQGLLPICGNDPEPAASYNIAATSSLLIYSRLETVTGSDGDTTHAGCVTQLSSSDIPQLFGNDWVWDVYLAQMYNAKTNAFLDFRCEMGDFALNPTDLSLPNPYQLLLDSDIWSQVIPLEASNGKRQWEFNSTLTEVVKGQARNRMRP